MDIAPAAQAPAARPRLDLFLIAILVGLVGLLAVAGISALFRQPAPELPVNTPGGTVQRFYTAMSQEDYHKAYLLLSDALPNKPTEPEFVSSNIRWRGSDSSLENDPISIESEKTSGETAYVTVKITHYYNNPGPFGGSGSWIETESFALSRVGGVWRVTAMPYRYNPHNEVPDC
jgi:hypothetical protein